MSYVSPTIKQIGLSGGSQSYNFKHKYRDKVLEVTAAKTTVFLEVLAAQKEKLAKLAAKKIAMQNQMNTVNKIANQIASDAVNLHRYEAELISTNKNVRKPLLNKLDEIERRLEGNVDKISEELELCPSKAIAMQNQIQEALDQMDRDEVNIEQYQAALSAVESKMKNLKKKIHEIEYRIESRKLTLQKQSRVYATIELGPRLPYSVIGNRAQAKAGEALQKALRKAGIIV